MNICEYTDGPQHVSLPEYGISKSSRLDKYKKYFKSPFESKRKTLSMEWAKCVLNPEVGIKAKSGSSSMYGRSTGNDRFFHELSFL